VALGSAGQPIGANDWLQPRFALFHAANSICSQKVRVVLAYHRLAYTSRTLNIFAGQTYLPDYVRLRLIGCERSDLPLVAGHTGSTAVASGGCDPAVVPTLIDRATDAVIVDSKRICQYLDEQVTEHQRLSPDALRTAIDAELDIVDNLPNYQMLTGKPAGDDRRPDVLRKNTGADFSLSKVRRCEQYLTEFAADTALLSAYNAKRTKELDAARHLYTPEAMQQAYDKASTACTQLNERLETRHGTWLLGHTVTMADLFWGVELLRMKNLGAGHFWEQDRLPAVARFVSAAEGLESIRSAVLTWPGALF
jgi:2,5-dichlorohydroquinone reductive dechlorinase